MFDFVALKSLKTGMVKISDSPETQITNPIIPIRKMRMDKT